MNKLLRSLFLLASIGLSSALFGGSVNSHVNSGERIEISVDGTTYGEIYITNVTTGQLAAVIYLAPYNPGTWGTSYYYNGGTYISGAALVENNFASATITGLPTGDYQIDAYGTGSMIDDGVYQSGNSSYIYQRSLYGYDDWIEFAFDIW